MNAPASIAMQREAAASAHAQSIRIHCPNCDELGIAVRIELATLRDQATVAIPRATDSAAVLLGEVSRVATFSVFSPRPTSELLRIKSALTLTMMAARAIERVQRNG